MLSLNLVGLTVAEINPGTVVTNIFILTTNLFYDFFFFIFSEFLIILSKYYKFQISSAEELNTVPIYCKGQYRHANFDRNYCQTSL